MHVHTGEINEGSRFAPHQRRRHLLGIPRCKLYDPRQASLSRRNKFPSLPTRATGRALSACSAYWNAQRALLRGRLLLSRCVLRHLSAYSRALARAARAIEPRRRSPRFRLSAQRFGGRAGTARRPGPQETFRIVRLRTETSFARARASNYWSPHRKKAARKEATTITLLGESFSSL